MRGRPGRFSGFRLPLIALVVGTCAFAVGAQSPNTAAPPPPSKNVAIVILGSGYPAPDPNRHGPSLAIVANGKAYLVDAGTGIVRQANAAFQRGTGALRPTDLDIAFLTHLHSDHTLGLADLIFTPWIRERTKPLRLYGPSGTKAMAGHILEAYQEDIRVRTTGSERGNTTGYKVEARDVEPGLVYKDGNVTVHAFLVKHGSWKEALGYRFDADGKSIVVSGDTSPAESVIDACNGCDALVHEVYSGTGSTKPSMSVEQWMAYMRAFHTSAEQLGEIAAKSRPKMLILTHWILLGNAKPEDMVRGIRERYKGPIVVARDLDLITP
jgi:ribonuclease BN (tRNA processing enzyme)